MKYTFNVFDFRCAIEIHFLKHSKTELVHTYSSPAVFSKGSIIRKPQKCPVYTYSINRGAACTEVLDSAEGHAACAGRTSRAAVRKDC